MNAHIILVYRFPEEDDEVFLQYTSEEFHTAKLDAVHFSQMYPEVLYLQLFEVEDGLEIKVYEWINPQSEKLTRRASNAGDAMTGPHTTWDFAAVAGPSSSMKSAKYTISRWGARPPLAEPFDSPSPTTSKTSDGLKRRHTFRALNRRSPRNSY
jgi:hypothetical protein